MVLLMTQPDAFHAASSARQKMEETLSNAGVLHTLRGLQSLSPLDGQIQLSELPLAAGQINLVDLVYNCSSLSSCALIQSCFRVCHRLIYLCCEV